MSFRQYSLVTCLLLALALLNGCSGGDNPHGPAFGAISGYVYISSAQALTTVRAGNAAAEGAYVRVQGTTLRTTTDANGFFTFSSVPVGGYTLLISKEGYGTVALPVTVSGGKTTDANNSVLAPINRKWTILVYMNGSNNLEYNALDNMNAMEAAPDGNGVTTVVQMSRSKNYATADGDWSGARRYLVQHDENRQAITSPIVQDLGATDMGQVSTLHNFLLWGQQQYPAEHYLVVVWNHGSGALPLVKSSDISTRAVSFDDDFGSYIRTADMDDALTVSPPVDVIAYDTCQTQMLEIAYQTRNASSYIVAAEDVTPANGMPYEQIFSELVATPTYSPRDLAVMIAQRTQDSYDSTTVPYMTQSVVDTSQLAGLTTAVDAFAGALINVAGKYPEQLSAAREATTLLHDTSYYAYRDLSDYAAQVKARVPDSTVQAAADGVITAVGNAVIAEYHYSENPRAHGISIFISEPLMYQRWYAHQYQALDLALRTRWNEWIGAQPQ